MRRGSHVLLSPAVPHCTRHDKIFAGYVNALCRHTAQAFIDLLVSPDKIIVDCIPLSAIMAILTLLDNKNMPQGWSRYTCFGPRAERGLQWVYYVFSGRLCAAVQAASPHDTIFTQLSNLVQCRVSKFRLPSRRSGIVSRKGAEKFDLTACAARIGVFDVDVMAHHHLSLCIPKRQRNIRFAPICS